MSASYWSLPGQAAPTEIPLFSGAGDEQNGNLWGDYSSMTVDPVGGCAFWYVNEYYTTNQIGTGKPVWQTRISTFSIPTCSPVTLAPSSLTFAPQAVGTTSPSQNLTLTNNQSATLNNIKITGSGNSADFVMGGHCGSTLAANSSCTIPVGLTPTTTGTPTATLTV